MAKDIFISYSRKDSEKVNAVVSYLENKGFSIWIDRKGIESGDLFTDSIVSAIEECTVVLFFSSESSNTSDWTAREIAVANKKKKKIIPIKLDNSDYDNRVLMFLVLLDYIDFTVTTETQPMLDKLIRSLSKECGVSVDDDIRNPGDSNCNSSEDVASELTKKATKLNFNVNGIGFNMVLVEHGDFAMGASYERRYVALTKDYYIGETMVTQELYFAVMKNNPSPFVGEKCPVYNISWSDCNAFIKKLNKLTGQKFRLPTEAEWEFAARGGNKNHGYIYAGSNNADEVAWYRDNSNNTIHPVALKKPNELGIYDMCGNGREWCDDLYIEDLPDGNFTNPKVKTGYKGVLRGSSFDAYNDYDCEIIKRTDMWRDEGYYHSGLRLVMSIPTK